MALAASTGVPGDAGMRELEEVLARETYRGIKNFVTTCSAVPQAGVDEALLSWSKRQINLPKWLAPFQKLRPMTCLRLNHEAGFGCSHGKKCDFEHICLLCGKPLHGVFQERQTGGYVCHEHARLDTEMDSLTAESGFTWENVEALISTLRKRLSGSAPSAGAASARSMAVPFVRSVSITVPLRDTPRTLSDISATESLSTSSSHTNSEATTPSGTPSLPQMPLSLAPPPPSAPSSAVGPAGGKSWAAIASAGLPRQSSVPLAPSPRRPSRASDKDVELARPRSATPASTPPSSYALTGKLMGAPSTSVVKTLNVDAAAAAAAGTSSSTAATAAPFTTTAPSQAAPSPTRMHTVDGQLTAGVAALAASARDHHGAARRSATAGAVGEEVSTSSDESDSDMTSPVDYPTEEYVFSNEKAHGGGGGSSGEPAAAVPKIILRINLHPDNIIADTLQSIVCDGEWENQFMGQKRKVAVKLVKLGSGVNRQEEKDKLKEAKRELLAISKLYEYSEFVVQMIYECSQVIQYPKRGGQRYFPVIMKRLDKHLAQYIVERDAPLVVPEVRALLVQLIKAYADCHERGIVHRDVKPENVLLDAAATGMPKVRLCDFGFSKIFEDKTSTRTLMSTQVGTHDKRNARYWIAPEMGNKEGYTLKADVWSLGCVIYFLATNGKALISSNDVIAKCIQDRAELGRLLCKDGLDTANVLVHDLVRRMAVIDPSGRLLCQKIADPNTQAEVGAGDRRYVGAAGHPACWSAESTLEIMADVHRRHSNMDPKAREVIKYIDDRAAVCLNGATDWTTKMPPVFVECIKDYYLKSKKEEDIPERYKATPSDLIRYLRNCTEHYKSFFAKSKLAAHNLSTIDETVNDLVQSVAQAFPHLLIVLFDGVHATGSARVELQNQRHSIRWDANAGAGSV